MNVKRLAGLTVLCVFLPVLGWSQEWTPMLSPVIQLSPDESTAVRRLAGQLKDAREREAKAEQEWIRFRDAFQTAHPDVAPVEFSADLHLAFTRRKSEPLLPQTASAVELTADEQRRGQAAYRELGGSQIALREANQDWLDRCRQLLADHLPPTGSGLQVTLHSGKQFSIPDAWAGGVAFTPDFRFAVPGR